jgi:hypothetical protein
MANQNVLPETLTFNCGIQYSFAELKGQSHEKFGEIRAWGLSLGHN